MAYKFARFTAFIKKTGLSREGIDDIIGWGEVYGQLLQTNHAGVYRDDDFEKLLVSKYSNENEINSKQTKLLKELHVISEPLATGGHTRLMEKMIALRKCADVLITRPVVDVESKLRLPCDTRIYKKTQGFDIAELIEILVKYKTIFLHINPDDLLSSIAVGVVKKKTGVQVIFVNHADHVFSFGFLCADLVAEVSSYGFFVSEKKRAVRSSFLGIPLQLDKFEKIEPNLPSHKGKYFEILSAGSQLKFKPSAALSFPTLAALILKEIPAARITIVGADICLNWWWWLTKLSNPARLRLLKSMPYDKYISTLTCADVYLDSLPMGGGTALPEVRSKGIPVSGILSGSSGYTPFDATKFLNNDALVASLREYSVAGSGIISNLNNDKNVIDSACWVHGPRVIKQRLDGIVDSGVIFRPYDDITIFDIDFYRKQWIEDRVVNVSMSSLRFFLKNWSSGGKNALVLFTGLINPRQVFWLIGSIFKKFLGFKF